jgi:hypothetical protein
MWEILKRIKEKTVIFKTVRKKEKGTIKTQEETEVSEKDREINRKG